MRATLFALVSMIAVVSTTTPRAGAQTEPSGTQAVSIAPPTSALAPLEPMESLPEIGGGRPLTWDEVRASVEAHHPTIDAAQARVASARGVQLAAEGGFDPGLSATGWVAPLGYYQYGRADISVTQATPLWGATLIAGWRIGRGIDEGGVPDYYGQLGTLDGGEIRAGLVVPLWRDGPIDARRAGITRAEQAVVAADRDLDARALRLQLAAADAYYRWIAAGVKAGVAIDLLRIAEDRDRQIAMRVAAGAIPAIEHLENRRAIFERRQVVVASRRALERAAIQLSLYLRDDQGAPRVVSMRRVPAAVVVPAMPMEDEDALVALALERRPELARFRSLREAARVAVELAENQVAPRIDIGAIASIDLGGGPPDGMNARVYSEPVLETWLTVQVPIGLREARGRADAAHAEVRALDADAELQADQIRIEVRDALSAVRAAREGLALAIASAEVAEQVAHGERTRFENGATSLLVVNLREAAAAQARAAIADAEAELRTSSASVLVAIGGASGDAPVVEAAR